jgi:hypothetical protein
VGQQEGAWTQQHLFHIKKEKERLKLNTEDSFTRLSTDEFHFYFCKQKLALSPTIPQAKTSEAYSFHTARRTAKRAERGTHCEYASDRGVGWLEPI